MWCAAGTTSCHSFAVSLHDGLREGRLAATQVARRPRSAQGCVKSHTGSLPIQRRQGCCAGGGARGRRGARWDAMDGPSRGHQPCQHVAASPCPSPRSRLAGPSQMVSPSPGPVARSAPGRRLWASATMFTWTLMGPTASSSRRTPAPTQAGAAARWTSRSSIWTPVSAQAEGLVAVGAPAPGTVGQSGRGRRPLRLVTRPRAPPPLLLLHVPELPALAASRSSVQLIPPPCLLASP